MKKTVIVFGLIAGFVVSVLMGANLILCYNQSNFEGNMLLGYATMLVAFSFIFVGIKNYRDKNNGGSITFGKAFKIGLYIALIASTIYVLAWLVEYYVFIPDFMDKYTAHELAEAKRSGATAAEMKEHTEQMQMYKDLYKNPVWVILMTYMEIIPVGIVVAFIAALILKKKPAATEVAIA